MERYIGVTGFMARREVDEVLEVMSAPGSIIQLMVGVLVSSKTLRGGKDRWPGRYPTLDKVADIFTADPRALNLIHYNTDEPETLFDQLFLLTMIAGPNLHGFQLNISWPPVTELKKIRKAWPKKFLVLQIGQRALKEAGDIHGFVSKIRFYRSLIDAVLIDPSGGEGKSFVPTEVRGYLEIAGTFFKPGIAGGLGPQTLDDLLKPLLPSFPNLSIDAEGRLRTPQPEDKLNIPTAVDYVRKSLALFRQFSNS